MIRTAQRRFAPTAIGITRNSDRHQIGISDRLRRNPQRMCGGLESSRIFAAADINKKPSSQVGDVNETAEPVRAVPRLRNLTDFASVVK
jgi:hypothetical protein